jgi:hypothetical protein
VADSDVWHSVEAIVGSIATLTGAILTIVGATTASDVDHADSHAADSGATLAIRHGDAVACASSRAYRLAAGL